MISIHTSIPQLPLMDDNFQGQICVTERANLPAATEKTYTCPPGLTGNVVVVQQLYKDHLSLVEVEVYGEGKMKYGNI